MRIQPTFISQRLSCGSTALTCRETGIRYNIGTDSHGFHTAYRNGTLIARRCTRNGALTAIESDARWSIHEQQGNQYAMRRRGRVEGVSSQL
jgi:hypothetical protein